MSGRIGLGVGRSAVRAVLLKGDGVVWRASTPLGVDDDLRTCIDRTLAAMPRRWGVRYRLTAAIGPSLAQLKSLQSLPKGNDRVLSEAIAANSGRFFLRNGVPLRVTPILRESPDVAWAAALDAPVVLAIEDACRAARVHYAGATASMSVIRYAIQESRQGQEVTWDDGDVVGESVFENGRLQSTVRRNPGGVSADIPPLVAELSGVNGGGWHFADAYAAARMNRRDPLLLPPAIDGARKRRWCQIRLGVLSLLATTAAATAAFAPGIFASRASIRGSAVLATLAFEQRELAAMQRSLAEVTRALQRGAEFEHTGASMTGLLSALTEAAPAMTAVLNLRIDSAGGTVLAISPSGADVFAAISQLPAVSRSEITAPLTKEVHDGAELERVSVRFEFARAKSLSVRRTEKSQP